MVHRVTLAVAVLAVFTGLAPPALAVGNGPLTSPPAGIGGGIAATCGPPDGTVEVVETDDEVAPTSAGVEVNGRARLTGDHWFTAWFEYRVAGTLDWRSTAPTNVSTNTCGQGWFEAHLRGLVADATYEYRAVASTANDTARGNVSRFSTGQDGRLTDAPDAEPAGTRTPTPDPCPSFRGTMGLCTSTPTPEEELEDERTTPAVDDAATVPPGSAAGRTGWLGGLLPLLSWVAVVVVVAPLVLGGLVWLEALRAETR